METICSSSPGDFNRDIELLHEAFGSAFSLEAIASAYSEAIRNVDMAGAILYDLQGQKSPISHQSENKESASGSSSDDTSRCPHTANGNVASPLPSNIVSGTPEGEYLNIALSGRGSVTSNMGSKDSFAKSFNTSAKDVNSLNQDVEEFLFKMLGDGFQLDNKKIHEVLGLCGYDLEKSIETLVDLLASSLGKSDGVISRTADREIHMNVDSYPYPEGSHAQNSSQWGDNGEDSCKKNKDKYDLQKEILGSLFTAPGRVEEQPKQIILRSRIVSRSSAFGNPVVKPLEEPQLQETFVIVKPLGAKRDDKFPVLRQAVKEYWALMKEYYKAATEAYEKGDHAKAEKLMEEGQFYKRKAIEADEESARKLLETREDEMLVDMSTLERKEAIKLLRLHLSNLAGIPTIRYLKLTVGDEADSKKGAVKRLILKQLEKESIKWIEVDDGKTIVIRLDEVDPKTLSFTKR